MNIFKLNGNTFKILKRGQVYRVYQVIRPGKSVPLHYPESSYETLSGAAYGLLRCVQKLSGKGLQKLGRPKYG